MANLAIKGHPTRGKEVIEILEMLGGDNHEGYGGTDTDERYIIEDGEIIQAYDWNDYIIYTLEEFLKKFPYKVGDKVTLDKWPCTITGMSWDVDEVIYYVKGVDFSKGVYVNDLKPYKEQEPMEDKGNISDGYHTFNELYEYRLLYNASMFNELAKQGLYDVHKSKLHSDGTIPFDDENWFIVQAELPTGQISNHYEIKDWDLFQIPVKEKANPYDGHSPQDVAKRLREFLTPKPKYPKTYEECCDVLVNHDRYREILVSIPGVSYKSNLIETFTKLLICRDAYWKIAGEQMGLGKPWEPDWKDSNFKYCLKKMGDNIEKTSEMTISCILAFPTEEMRDAFYENFKELINECKELL